MSQIEVQPAEKFSIRLPNNQEPRNMLGVFYRDLKPVIMALKVMATLPLSTSKSGEVEFRLFSISSLYSVVTYLCLLALWFSRVMKQFVAQIQFDHMVNRISVVTYFLLVFCMPFTVWRETRGIAIYINNWRQFEVQFCQLTHRTLKLNLHQRSLVLLVFSITVSFIMETVYVTTKSPLKVIKWFINFYQTTHCYLLGALLYLLCLALVRAAESILTSLKSDVKARSSKCGAVMAEYRVLWLRLSRLAEQVGTSCCYTFGFFILYLFLNLTLCLYLSCAYTRDIRSIVINSETSLNCILLLYVVCDAGQTVTKQVTEAFHDELMNMRSEPAHPNFVREMDIFIKTIQVQKSAVNLGGYVLINRQLIVSLVSALVTYLIVLLQFQFQTEETI